MVNHNKSLFLAISLAALASVLVLGMGATSALAIEANENGRPAGCDGNPHSGPTADGGNPHHPPVDDGDPHFCPDDQT